MDARCEPAAVAMSRAVVREYPFSTRQRRAPARRSSRWLMAYHYAASDRGFDEAAPGSTAIDGLDLLVFTYVHLALDFDVRTIKWHAHRLHHRPQLVRPRGPAAARIADVDGHLGAVRGGTRDHRGARADVGAMAVGDGYLRLRDGRPARHDGRARRPVRTETPPFRRRRVVRCGVGDRGLRAERRAAHRRPGHARDRRRDAR